MSDYALTDIRAYEIIDNRGMPTIRVAVCIDNAFWGRADVPCGSSTGSSEAVEIRDGGTRYGGKGVRTAIQNIHDVILPRLRGRDATRQRDVDHLMLELDGTANKSKLGANAILGVSLAVARAAANATLCKVNQIGTLTETAETVDFARQNNYAVVMSERSGETEDSILSDISVAFNAGLFKTGGIRGSDRGTNYNRFIEIEQELGSSAVYAGSGYRR
jgi:enolase